MAHPVQYCSLEGLQVTCWRAGDSSLCPIYENMKFITDAEANLCQELQYLMLSNAHFKLKKIYWLKKKSVKKMLTLTHFFNAREKKIIPAQHCKSLGCFLNTQGVLVQHINRWNKETSPGHIISVEVTVGYGTEQVVVLPGQSSAADGNSQLIHKFLQGVNINLQKKTSFAVNGCFEEEGAKHPWYT